ncbi:hypothetical protein CCMA1212_010430 [Trichoderma ghanense]|uniref:Uncharacterized protein n=1 Tax=Trichoderma ghanense TaxID=65468 RepID=A0ABY2GQQ7_9HYPO
MTSLVYDCKTTLNGAETWFPCPHAMTTTAEGRSSYTLSATKESSKPQFTSTSRERSSSPSRSESTEKGTSSTSTTATSGRTPTRAAAAELPDSTSKDISTQSRPPPTTPSAIFVIETPSFSAAPAQTQEFTLASLVPVASQTLSPPPQKSTSLSPGVIAGIAVGCVVGGLLIGLVTALLLLRRGKGKKPSSRSDAASILVESKALSVAEISERLNTGASSGTSVQLDQFLLDGAPDQEIVNELQSLGELIRQHVEDHYTLRPVGDSVEELSQLLLKLGLGPGIDTQSIAAGCSKSSSRHLGIRSVISHVIFTSIDFHSPGELSLLPEPVAGLLQSIPAAKPTDGDSQGPIAFSQALHSWRRQSAFLLHSNRSQRTALQVDTSMIAPKAQMLTQSLNSFLDTFVDPGTNEEQTSHLQDVVIECAKLGYMLFSHPVDWRFVFEGTPTGTTSISTVVVCPGLEKCSDREGNPYTHPRRVAAPIEAAL